VGLYNPDLYPREVIIEVRAAKNANWEKLPHDVVSAGRELLYRFPPTEAGEIRFSATSATGQNRLVLAELALETGKPIAKLPEIGNYLSDVFATGGNRFLVRLKRHGLGPDEIAIQYRCADTVNKIFGMTWPFDFLTPGEPGPVLADKPYCQFRVTHVANRSNLAWSDFEVKPLESPR
jgi:hypothetical protein